jgi:HEAT repeat protein
MAPKQFHSHNSCRAMANNTMIPGTHPKSTSLVKRKRVTGFAFTCLAIAEFLCCAGAHCSAGIIYPKAPPNGRSIVNKNLDLKFLGVSRLKDLTIAEPFKEYFVSDLTNVNSKPLLFRAKLGAWKYVLMRGTNGVGEALLDANSKTGKIVGFNSLEQPGFANEMLEALRRGRQLPEVNRRNYEVRFLEVTAVYFVAVWLHNEQDDILLPLPPTFGRMKAYLPYSEDQIAKILKSDIERVTESSEELSFQPSLDSDDVELRIAALAALDLKSSQAKDSIPAISKLAMSSDLRESMSAIHVLNRMGTAARDASSVLVQIIMDKTRDERVRYVAAYALTRVRPSGEQTVAVLVPLLQENDREMRMLAVASLGAIGPEATEAVPPLLKQYKKEDDSGRIQIIHSLGNIASDKAVPILIEALKDKTKSGRSFVREASATALGQIGPKAKAAVPDLISTLEDPEPSIRRAAAIALGNIGSDAKEAVPILERLLNDPELPVSSSARSALGRITGEN